eukprot:CAMPEP_0195299314 /NCGR_PEP_ID=MMETSP0707-20130614/25329_1 /TAXON_ID=33640 /ORGANISM="Asterionellopsis glacialis, Strain CCMP134" /LENGTH=150 /DNA_ID=CAMNT_0040361691 /DNA_START=352 /DNA_END=804 /DNA_ORIENTATION=-
MTTTELQGPPTSILFMVVSFMKSTSACSKRNNPKRSRGSLKADKRAESIWFSSTATSAVVELVPDPTGGFCVPPEEETTGKLAFDAGFVDDAVVRLKLFRLPPLPVARDRTLSTDDEEERLLEVAGISVSERRAGLIEAVPVSFSGPCWG